MLCHLPRVARVDVCSGAAELRHHVGEVAAHGEAEEAGAAVRGVHADQAAAHQLPHAGHVPQLDARHHRLQVRVASVAQLKYNH